MKQPVILDIDGRPVVQIDTGIPPYGLDHDDPDVPPSEPSEGNPQRERDLRRLGLVPVP